MLGDAVLIVVNFTSATSAAAVRVRLHRAAHLSRRLRFAAAAAAAGGRFCELSNTSKNSSPESRKKATLWENVESASPPVAPAR